MKKEIVIKHVSTVLKTGFDSFTDRLEKALGVLTPATLHALGANPASMAPYLNNTADDNKLVLFNMLTQQDLTKSDGSQRIRQYQVGNPRIMSRMIAGNAGAGLYIPVHLLVFEKRNGKAMLQFDLPSSLFAQFNNPLLYLDSVNLENSILNLVRLADENPNLS